MEIPGGKKPGGLPLGSVLIFHVVLHYSSPSLPAYSCLSEVIIPQTKASSWGTMSSLSNHL